MADFFKGLAGGMQTGLQFGQQLRKRRMDDELAQVYAKPETSQGYTPADMAEMRRQQETGAYDIQGIPGAEGQPPTLRYTPRQGLDLQGDVPAAPTDFAPQQVQRYGGQTVAGQFDPTVLRGLQMQEAARVLGSYGDVRGAAALQAQAEEQAYQAKYRPLQLRQLEGQITGQGEDRAYQAKRRPLELQSLEGQIAGQSLTQQAQKITISKAEREAEQEKSNRTAQTLLAKMSADGIPIDTVAANRIAAETGADMKFVTDAVLGQYKLTRESANDLIERQLTNFNKAAEGGIPTLNKYIAERLDPDNTDNIVPMIVQGKDGKLRVMYGDKPLPGYQSYSDINQLSAAFQGNIKRDPLSAAIQISTLETQLQARKASEAAVRASDATVGLKNTQMKMFSDQAAGNAEAQQIRAKFTALTPEEQVGPKGQGLMRDFNMANAKAGMSVPLGTPPRAERPALSEADATARAKAMVEAKELGPTGKRLTFTEALDVVRGTPPAPGTPAAARAQINALLGSGADPFSPPPTAARPTTGLQSQTAPARNAPAEPNPYVDARGRPLAVTPAGAPSMASTAIPAAASAVESAVGSQAAATRYLQAKIARNEPLTATDRARAVQLGLVRQ